MVATMAAQIWFRFIPMFESYPHLVAKIVDPRLTEAQQLEAAETFFDADMCDVDAGFGMRLREVCQSARALLADEDTLSLLRIWARKTRLSNMNTERLIAKVRKCTPRKRPDLQRMVASGTLGQWSTKHLQVGGQDPRIVKASHLIEQGVPLRASKCGKFKQGARKWTKARPHMLYGNEVVEVFRTRLQKPSPEQCAEVRRQAMRRFCTLPEATKHRYVKYLSDKVALGPVETERLPEPRPYDPEGSMWGLAGQRYPLEL